MRCNKGVALTKLARWYEEVEKLNSKFFNSVIQTMQNNYATIPTTLRIDQQTPQQIVSMLRSRLLEISLGV